MVEIAGGKLDGEEMEGKEMVERSDGAGFSVERSMSFRFQSSKSWHCQEMEWLMDGYILILSRLSGKDLNNLSIHSDYHPKDQSHLPTHPPHLNNA